MNYRYKKQFPRGSTSKLEAIEALLLFYTERLNLINGALFFISKVKSLPTDNQDEFLPKLLEIEKQGRFNAFLIIVFLDLNVIYKNANSTVHFWEEMHTLRQGYLLIFEALITYNSHSQDLKELCAKSSRETQWKFAALTAGIKEFRKEFGYEDVIRETRNCTVAHIEKDPVLFFKRISDFDQDKAILAVEAFARLIITMLEISEDIFKSYTRKLMRDYAFLNIDLYTYSEKIKKIMDAIDNQADKNPFASNE